MPARSSTQRLTASRPPDTMASASEDQLAHLSGADLAVHLSNTFSRADFEVVARILRARDRRNAKVEAELRAALADLDAASARGSGDAEITAELEAALTELDALRDKYKALLDPFLRPQYEVEELALMVGAASPDSSRVEEAKEAEVKGMDIVDLCSDEEEGERAAGGCEEEEEDTESLSQRAKRLRLTPGELESGKGDVHVRGLSDGELESDGVPATGLSQLSKGTAKIDKTPAKCGNKEVGAEKCASLPRLTEEPRITRAVVPFESCNENNTNVQVKREVSLLPSTATSEWATEAGIVISLLDHNNVEVHMQALCALYRQGKLAIDDKRKQVRAHKLAEFLLDGDLGGPMKRTAQELKKLDDAAFARQVALDFSEQLFDIYRNKEDLYFC